MPTFTGKTFASFYKNLLGIDQSSNTGIDGLLRRIQDGAGKDSCIFINGDQLWVKPVNADAVNTLCVLNTGGTIIFKVDTTNSKVLIGASQIATNTQYAHFAVSSATSTAASMVADTHYAIPFGGSVFAGTSASFAMGSSTDSSFNDTNPATSLTISTTAMDIVNTYWYVMDDITIDAVKWLHAADTATGEATAGHLMAYSIVSDNSSTSGDLSSGVVVADGANITNAGYEQIYYQSMTVQSADVDAGQVILFTFASDTVNSDYSINATIKYHIR